MSAAETIPRALGCVLIRPGSPGLTCSTRMLEPQIIVLRTGPALIERPAVGEVRDAEVVGPWLLVHKPVPGRVECADLFVVQPVEAVELLPGAVVHVPQRQAPVGRVLAVAQHHA